MRLLSRIEEIILLSIWKLQDNAYGMTIRDEVIAVTGKKWLLGAIYAPLARLHKNGLVSSTKGEPMPERGGRAKVFYRLTPRGKDALMEVEKINSVIWKGLRPIVSENE